MLRSRLLRGTIPHHRHHHLSSIISLISSSKPHPTVRPLATAYPTINLTHTQFHLLFFSTSTSTSSLNPNQMDSEPEPSLNSLSAAAMAADGEGGGGADVRNYAKEDGEEESVVANGERGVEESDEQSVLMNGGGGEEEVDRKVELPEELASSVMKLTCESMAVEGGVCDVYLVGTAHVSSESCQVVQAVISCLKPQVVFLELCSSRVTVLQPQNLKVPTAGEMVEMWKKNHNLFGILYGWFLAKVASKLEVLPGAEFRMAFEEAMKYGGKVILGDRPVQLKDMDDVDMLTLVIQEMSKQFPTLMETLVHERDKYMSSTLLRVASEHSSVVAVVGKGHLTGIKKHWKQPIEVKELLAIPMQKPAVSVGKIFTTIGIAVAGVAIVSGIYLSSKNSSSCPSQLRVAVVETFLSK